MNAWLLDNYTWLFPLFITIIFSLLNIIVAICNLKIVSQQSKMQNDMFCFQLFEKRHKNYEDLQKVLCAVISSGKVTIENINEFAVATKDIKFLFGKDMSKFCEDALNKLSRLRAIGRQIEYNIQHNNDNENHSNLCDEEGKLLLAVLELQNHISTIALEYISFSNYKINKR